MSSTLKIAGVISVLASLVCFLGPIACCLLAGAIADYCGVHLSGAGPVTMLLCGQDIGEFVWELSMMPWLLFITAPVGMVLLPLGGILYGIGKDKCT